MSIFSKIQLKRPKSSTFNLSHQRKFSLNMGELVPMFLQECVPGDKFKISTSQVMRLMPMLAPMMHEVNVVTHYFFIPNRILWTNWENFITGGENGLDKTLFPVTDVMFNENQIGSLADYLGIPQHPEGDDVEKVNMLPFLAYNMIYNEYYRDQNLIDPVDLTVVDGYNEPRKELFTLKKRAWGHDYFTSALPWAQKGAPVSLPLGKTVPIRWKDTDDLNVLRDGNGERVLQDSDGNLQVQNGNLTLSNGQVRNPRLDNSSNLEADLSEAIGATVSEFRAAFKLQEWLEKNARAGSRYIESILSHFGVRSSDARLQRPEYLGGGMSPMLVSEVLQTSETQDSPQGNMAGHGVNFGKNGFVSKFCEEHGFIMGIVSVMPKASYQQGLSKIWKKDDKFDYFWPEFEHIGEQEIQQGELFYTGSQKDQDTFGYIPRYSEYKYIPNSVHGQMKTTLDFWHMGRKFNPDFPPKLNAEFINCDPTHRVFAVEDNKEHKLICQMYHNITARRLMSYYSSPHF